MKGPISFSGHAFRAPVILLVLWQRNMQTKNISRTLILLGRPLDIERNNPEARKI